MKNPPRDAAMPQPSASLSAFISALAGENADAMLVDLAGNAMTAKLAKKREEGRGGWHQPKPEIDAGLRASLKEHVEKGDMVDVINLAAMIHVRGEIYGRAVTVAPAKSKAVKKTAKKKPAAKKPASFKRPAPKRTTPKRASPPAKADKANKLQELLKQARPLFLANPKLDREGLIKKIGRAYERITTFAELRATLAPRMASKANTPQKTTTPKTTEAKAPAGKTAKSAKPADDKQPWTVKAAGKTVGSTIFEKKVGDTIKYSTGTFTVLSIDAEKREIQVEGATAKPTTPPASDAPPEAKTDSAPPEEPKPAPEST